MCNLDHFFFLLTAMILKVVFQSCVIMRTITLYDDTAFLTSTNNGIIRVETHNIISSQTHLKCLIILIIVSSANYFFPVSYNVKKCFLFGTYHMTLHNHKTIISTIDYCHDHRLTLKELSKPELSSNPWHMMDARRLSRSAMCFVNVS